MMAYLKEKKCERKGKFRAPYLGPYIITKVHLVECKFSIEPTRVGVVAILFKAPTFDLLCCTLDTDLNNSIQDLNPL